MKPLLRVVLIVDALVLLGFGVLFLLTPWTSLYNALQLVQPQPVLVGLVLGVVLLGLSWLAARAAIDGAMTVPVGRVAGHVNWICGALLLVWLIALHTPQLSGFGQLIAGGIGAWMIVIGFGGVRLAGAVRQREKALAADAASARRDARSGAKSEAYAEPAGRTVPVFAAGAPVKAAPSATAATASSAAQPPVSPQLPASAQQTAPSADDAHRAARDEAAHAPRPPLHG